MSEWSENNSSQTSLSTLWLCKPFGLKRNKFVINFRKNSKKFILEILTKNIALNLSGALFFIGIGYSLKWWYKDQLFIILLKQNLPVFSEPENKISWETGEYALNQIKEQQKRQKNVPIFQIFNTKSVPNSASSLQEGEFQQPLGNYLLEEDYNTSKQIPSLSSYPQRVAKRSFAQDKDSFFHSDLNVEPHEVLEFDSLLAKTPSFCLKQPIQVSKKVGDTINYLSPVGVQFAKQLGVSYGLIDRIDLYTNQIVVKLKQPWQKHVYQRFTGIFAKSNPSTSYLAKHSFAYTVSQVKEKKKLRKNNLLVTPKEDTMSPSQATYEVPIIADNITLSPNPSTNPVLMNTVHNSGGKIGNMSNISDVKDVKEAEGLAKLKTISTKLDIVSNSEIEKDTKFRNCSSEKRTNNFQTADNRFEEQEKFSIYTPWKQLFPETWFKLSARNLCFLNQEFSPAFNPLSGLAKREAISPTPYRGVIVPPRRLEVDRKSLMYSREKGHKELNVLRPTVFLDKVVTTLGNTMLSIFNGKPWYNNYINELTTLGKLSYPLELTKTLTGWQPSIDVLILNSYLDEIPYKLENVLQPYFPKKDSELLFLSTSFIKSNDLLLIESIDSSELSYMQSDTLRTPKGVSKKLIDSVNNSSNLNAPLSLQRTESMQKKYDLLLTESRDNEAKKVVVNTKKASETSLKKSQLFEIKQLLKNELQSLINTLPLTVIDQFFCMTPERGKKQRFVNPGSNEYLQKIVSSQELSYPLGVCEAEKLIEKKDVADVTTNVLGVKAIRDLTRNTPFNMQTPLNPSADLFYGAKKNLYIPLVTENIFFPSTPPVPRPPTEMNVYPSGVRRSVGDNKIFDVTSETLSLYQTQAPSNEKVSSLEQFPAKGDFTKSSTRVNSALTDFVKTQSLDPLLLLNGLGFTFNNFSPLTNPTILLPTNTNSSPTFLTPNAVRLWKQVVSTKLPPNFANIISEHLVPQKGKKYKEFSAPLNFVQVAKHALHKKLIGFSYNKAKYNDSQNSNVEGMLLQEKPLNLNQSKSTAKQSFASTELMDSVNKKSSYLVASQLLQEERWKNHAKTFFNFNEKNLIWEIFQQPKYDEYLSPNIKDKITIDDSLLTKSIELSYMQSDALRTPKGVSKKLIDSNKSINFVNNSFTSETLNPSELETQVFASSNASYPQRDTKTSPLFHNNLEKNNTENHQLVSKAQSDQTYNSEKTKKEKKDRTSHIKRIIFSQKKIPFGILYDVNLVDKAVNFVNKKSRCMSGYVYPDIQSDSLKTYLYQWLSKSNDPTLLALRQVFLFPSFTSNLSTSYFAKHSFLPQRGKRTITPLEFPFETSLLQLMDKACLTSLKIPITPTTFLLRFFQQQPSSHFGQLARTLPATIRYLPADSFNIGDVTDVTPVGFAKLGLAQPITPFDISRQNFPRTSKVESPRLISFRTEMKDGSKIPYRKFNHYLAKFPGFSESSQFLTNLSIDYISPQEVSALKMQYPASNISNISDVKDFKAPYAVQDTNKSPTASYKVENPSFSPLENGKRTNLNHDLITPFVTSPMYRTGSMSDGEINKLFVNCNTRKVAYRGIVVQRNNLTKDFQPFKGFIKQSSIWGTLFLGAENPLTDRQCHFFGQKQLSTLDTNSFQRDYLRQLGKEILIQSNSKGFTELSKFSSIERTKILSFSKKVNSFFFKKRKYSYLLEPKDQWHLLFQKQLRTALEDGRKYPPLHSEGAKSHSSEETKFNNAGRIKVSAPLIMARFPKEIATLPLINDKQNTIFQGNTATNISNISDVKDASFLQRRIMQRKEPNLQHNIPWRPFCIVEPSHLLMSSFLPFNCRGSAKQSFATRYLNTPYTTYEDNFPIVSISTYGLSCPDLYSAEHPLTKTFPIFLGSTTKKLPVVTLHEKQNYGSENNSNHECPTASYSLPCKALTVPLPLDVQSYALQPFTPSGSGGKKGVIKEGICLYDNFPGKIAKLKTKIIQHYPFSTERSYFEISDTTWPNKNNGVSSLHSLVQEPLNGNSWTVINQWIFLIALLLWIEQILLDNVLPSLFALEQILLGITGIKSGDRTHVIRISKSETPKFQNLAGVDGLLGELSELVLFLRGQRNVGERFWNNKNSYGVLLTGPPGTGKTFLVRALANEANVPVLILSASTLAANKLNSNKPSWSIRHAFRRAKQLSPCILFIDELDALGKSRGKIVTDINEIVTDANVGSNATLNENWPSVSNLLLNKWENPIKSTLFQESNEINRNSLCKEKLFDLLKGDAERESNGGTDKFSFGTTPLNETNKSKTRDFEAKISFSSEAIGDSQEYQNSNKYEMIQNSTEIGENTKRKFGPLTQLLVSMDGVSSFSGVLIMGATNRPELLDPALTRPGRFEKIIRLEKPSEQNRIEILQLYSHNLGVQHQIPWSYLANRTRGLTTADLSVAMNYSSLKAISEGSTHTIETIEYGLNSIARSATTSLSSYPLSEGRGLQSEGRQTTIPIKVNLKKDKITIVQSSKESNPLTKRAIFSQRHFNSERNLLLPLRAYKTIHRTFSDPLWGSEVQQAIPSTKIKSNSLTIFSSYFTSNLLTIYPVLPKHVPPSVQLCKPLGVRSSGQKVRCIPSALPPDPEGVKGCKAKLCTRSKQALVPSKGLLTSQLCKPLRGLAKLSCGVNRRCNPLCGLTNQNTRKGALTPNRELEAAKNLSTSCLTSFVTCTPEGLQSFTNQRFVLALHKMYRTRSKKHALVTSKILQSFALQPVLSKGDNMIHGRCKDVNAKHSFACTRTPLYFKKSFQSHIFYPRVINRRYLFCLAIESKRILPRASKKQSYKIAQTAYYQAGKIVVQTLLPEQPPVALITLNTSTAADTYLPIENTFNSQCCSFLESRLISLYGGKAASLLIEYQYKKKLAVKSEKANSIALRTFKGVSKKLMDSLPPLLCTGGTNNKSTKAYAYCAGTGNNLFQSTIGNIEIQIATRLATIMVHYWSFYSSSSKYLQNSNVSLSISFDVSKACFLPFVLAKQSFAQKGVKREVDFYPLTGVNYLPPKGYDAKQSFAIDRKMYNKGKKKRYPLQFKGLLPTVKGKEKKDGTGDSIHPRSVGKVDGYPFRFLKKERRHSSEVKLNKTNKSSYTIDLLLTKSIDLATRYPLTGVNFVDAKQSFAIELSNHLFWKNQIPRQTLLEATRRNPFLEFYLRSTLSSSRVLSRNTLQNQLPTASYSSSCKALTLKEGICTYDNSFVERKKSNNMTFVASSAPLFKENTKNQLFKNIANSSSVERIRLSFKGLTNLDLSDGLNFNQLRKCFVKTKIPLSVTKRPLTISTPSEGPFPLGKIPLLTRFDEKYFLFTNLQSKNSLKIFKRNSNTTSSYNMLRTSVENIGEKPSKFFSQINIFQLINSLQFSNLERNRFYPGWFRLYLPDIEATQFFKNVGNFYFNLGLQTLTRPSLNELTLKNSSIGLQSGALHNVLPIPTSGYMEDLHLVQSSALQPFTPSGSGSGYIFDVTKMHIVSNCEKEKGIFSLVQNLKKFFFYHTNNNLSIGVGLLRYAAKRRNKLNRIEYRSKDSPLSYFLHKTSPQEFQVSDLPSFSSDKLAKLQKTGFYISLGNQEQTYQQDIKSSFPSLNPVGVNVRCVERVAKQNFARTSIKLFGFSRFWTIDRVINIGFRQNQVRELSLLQILTKPLNKVDHLSEINIGSYASLGKINSKINKTSVSDYEQACLAELPTTRTLIYDPVESPTASYLSALQAPRGYDNSYIFDLTKKRLHYKIHKLKEEQKKKQLYISTSNPQGGTMTPDRIKKQVFDMSSAGNQNSLLEDSSYIRKDAETDPQRGSLQGKKLIYSRSSKEITQLQSKALQPDVSFLLLLENQIFPINCNGFSVIEKELLSHSLMNNCFAKAFQLVNQNRQLLDFFADYLLRFQILRQHQILYLFSAILLGWRQASEGRPLL